MLIRKSLLSLPFVAIATTACATPTTLVKRTIADVDVRGIEQVDYAYVNDGTATKSEQPKKLLSGRPDDTSDYYYITKANGLNPNMGNRLTRHYTNGNDKDQCTIASSVSDFKIITNPASRFAAIYVQDGSLYGVDKSDAYPPGYHYSPFCVTGPSKTEWMGGGVVKDSAGRYQYWTYLPAPGENAEHSLSHLVLEANPSTNLVIYTADGKESVIGVIDQLALNPCFHIRGKPYQSFVAFVHYKNGHRVGWIDPANPHDSDKTETSKDVGSIADFMATNHLSSDGGKTCE